jgi:hypothetical protein
MMIQMCTFPPQRGKSSNCNDVRYGCLDGLRGDYHHSDHSHALYIGKMCRLSRLSRLKRLNVLI